MNTTDNLVFEEDEINEFKCEFFAVPEKITFKGTKVLQAAILHALDGLEINTECSIDMPVSVEQSWKSDSFSHPVILVHRHDKNIYFVQIVWRYNGSEIWVEGDLSRFIPEKDLPYKKQSSMPTIVIEMNGGSIKYVRSSMPVRVVMLDEDTEGGDEDHIHKINGEKVFLSDYVLSHDNRVLDGNDGIDADYVEDVIAQIDNT